MVSDFIQQHRRGQPPWFVQCRMAWEKGSGMAILSDTQQDQVKIRVLIGREIEKLTYLFFIFAGSDLGSRFLYRDRMEVLGRNS